MKPRAPIKPQVVCCCRCFRYAEDPPGFNAEGWFCAECCEEMDLKRAPVGKGDCEA